ncbi:MAG: transglycosylase domain-containing protein, partial [Clostridia bacterium]|nr:transglycosylase domain-containing protein [Clostridia bacterium]
MKIFLVIITTLLSLAFVVLASFMLITAGTNLDSAKLVDYKKTITIYDDEGNKIENASSVTGKKTVNVSNLQDYTLNAFIASEDRNFYSHNGLNYKRMLKALYRNITTMSFKEGASTISQQLIKNTHLSSDKTLTRKLKEIKLTRQLERRYEKNEILEMYLNTIYFGHNCYGLQSASQFYFNKPAELLNLEQSATLAGLLSSPNNYSPFKNPEKSLARRNTVLKSMKTCGYID